MIEFDTMMEGGKPIVFEKFDFECQDVSKLLAVVTVLHCQD